MEHVVDHHKGHLNQPEKNQRLCNEKNPHDQKLIVEEMPLQNK